MTDVGFGLLGPMEITVAGAPVRLPGPAERSLLAQLLLVPSRTVPATMLIDTLWSESALPVDPVNALQIRVSKLRRVMAAQGVPDLVVREGTGYRVNAAPDSVDAVRFTTLLSRARSVTADDPATAQEDRLEGYDEALLLWRGEPLADFQGEAWALVEAGRLHELRLAALTERARIALDLGRHLEVVADLDPLVAQDPTLESLAGLLMVALYRSGRQAAALDVYARTRRVLDEELGLEPSMSLRSLHGRILQQDAGLEAPSLAGSAPALGSPRRRHGEAPRDTNLPTRQRPLIGREELLDQVAQLLDGVRLLSLIGPGGAGKTSLALAVVDRVRAGFPDGAYGVRLAGVAGGDQVAYAVADALGVPLDGAAADHDVRERLAGFLARRRLLLLVDNCEHVVDAAAALVDDLLARCPNLRVLTTSREALAVPDEVQVTVGPLETPPPACPTSSVLDYPAAQLFVERARAVRPGALFPAHELDAIGKLTRALDGIPLALELAASRVAAMSPGEILERLDDRFSLLTSGARTAEARQQTLRATVDWSYALLSRTEQQVFDRLSVFQGGWTLTAAEAVVADVDLPPAEVVNTIGRLVERSMVVVDRGPLTRYRMLETLRQYAVERLHAGEGADVVRRRHAEHFCRFAEESEQALRGRGQREALRRLHAEQPNIRAALTWLQGPSGDPETALRMAGSLGLFWHLGRHLEGRDVLGRVLGSAPEVSTAARARALQAVSLVERPRACLVHPSPRCATAAEESLRLFEELGDPSRAALSRVLLAVEEVTGRDPDRLEALLGAAEEQFIADRDAWGRAVIGFVRMEAALKAGDAAAAVPVGRSTAAAFRHLDDPWGLSATLYHLGWGLRQFGRYDEATRVLEEAVDVATGAGLHNTAQWALADLGIAQLHLGRPEAAEDLFARAAAASEHIGDGAGEVLATYGRGLLAQLAGDWSRARDRFTTATIGFTGLGTPVMEGWAILGLARCDEVDGALDLADGQYERALGLGREGGEPGLQAAALEGRARTAQLAGDPAAARELLADAVALRCDAHRPRAPHEERDVAPLGDLAPVR